MSLETNNTFVAKLLLLRLANYHCTAGFFLRDNFRNKRLVAVTKKTDDVWTLLLLLIRATEAEVQIPLAGKGLRPNKFTQGNTIKGTVSRTSAPPHGFGALPLVIGLPSYDGQTQEDHFYLRPFLDTGCHTLVLSLSGRRVNTILNYGPQMRSNKETTVSSAINWALGEGSF